MVNHEPHHDARQAERPEPSPCSATQRPRAGSGTLRLFLLPFVLFFILMGITLLLWRQEAGEQEAMLRSTIKGEQLHAARRLESAVHDRLEPVMRLAIAWRNGRLQTQRQFLAEAGAAAQEGRNYLVIGWVGSNGICRLVTPLPGNEGMIGTRLSDSPLWAEAFAHAMDDTRGPSGVVRRHPVHESVYSIVIPVGATEDGAVDGAIIAQLELKSVLADALGPLGTTSHGVELRDERGPIYAAGRGDASSIVIDADELHVLDGHWYLRLTPTKAYIGAWSAREPRWVLAGGIAISMLVTGLAMQALYHRWRDAELTHRHLTALESLNQIATAVSSRPGAQQELLDRLAAEPRNLLGVSRSFISLMDAAGEYVHIVSYSTDTPLGPDFPMSYPTGTVPSMVMVLKHGQVVTSNDVEKDARLFAMDTLHVMSIRSLMMLPLVMQDRVVGLWTVTCDRRHAFRDVEVRLARLWASQIALALANGHFFEQMQRALDAQRKVTDQRDMLAAVNAAMFQAATVDESVAQIANLGPGALGVDMCIACLMAGPDEMVIAAANGEAARLVLGQQFSTRAGNAHRAVASRQLLVIEDASADPDVNPYFRDLLNIRSIVYVPLYRNDGSPIGMLGLVRHAPSTFDAEQRRLIQIFATRAAAALETAELHEQTRRDAETKAMLLRELNHRVKNNLAGIIGLLSAGGEELPERARQWLDRAVERIAMMARAHELFAGGVKHVSLADLVDQILPSLSIVKPAGVEIRTDLGSVGVFLHTDRAVSVAMVLHELCYNGIVHGLGTGRGTLSIAAHVMGDNRVVIEVANDSGDSTCSDGRKAVDDDIGNPRSGDHGYNGPGTTAVADRVSVGTGLGLKLVDGLVKRELRGTFTLAPAADGDGTVATVEFPLLVDELQESD